MVAKTHTTMPLPGKANDPLIAYYGGDPTGVSMNTLNISKGTIVIDFTTPAIYQKTSTTDNSTFDHLTNVNSATITGATLVSSIISTGLTATGSAANDFSGSTGTFLTSSGMTTISGPLKTTVQSLSGTGTLTPNVTTTTTTVATVGGTGSGTLPDGVAGQIKIISMIADAGDYTLTVTNLQGGTTIVFGDVGDSVILQFQGTKWTALSLTGVSIS